MNSNQVASTSANKASQRDQKTAASLWFFGPCWRRYVSRSLGQCQGLLTLILIKSAFMEITKSQFKIIEHLLPLQRGNVKIPNIQVINAVLYVAE
ncbi:hypothetical protein AB1S50_09130, partial [Microbulbifer sp. 2201CG32-9]